MATRVLTNAPKVNTNKRGGGSAGTSSAKPTSTATSGGDPQLAASLARIAGVPHWDDDPDAWDICFLGGREVPGVCSVSVVKEREVKRNKPKGKSGASTTDDGYAGATVKITWRLWTTDQWAMRKHILAAIDPRPNEPVVDQAITVGHAVFADRGVSSIIITKVTGPDRDGDGARVYSIDAYEWLPPPKKSATGTVAGEAGTDKTVARPGSGDKGSPPTVHGGNPPSGLQYDENGTAYNKKGGIVLGDTI